MQETRVQYLGQEDTLEKEMATHSSNLSWKILWMEEPDRLQSMGLQSQTWLSNFTFFHFLFLSQLSHANNLKSVHIQSFHFFPL